VDKLKEEAEEAADKGVDLGDQPSKAKETSQWTPPLVKLEEDCLLDLN